MNDINSVLFVCTGNLCRSVMAEGLLKKILGQRGQEGIRVSSAGTWGEEGASAAPETVDVCRERGVDVSSHRARRLSGEILRQNDLVVVMEMDHLERVIELDPEALHRVRMLSEYGGTEKGRYASIPDPYMKGREKFEACCDRIDRHIRALAKNVF